MMQCLYVTKIITSELSARGAKRDVCQALPAVGQLLPSVDDDDVDVDDVDDDDDVDDGQKRDRNDPDNDSACNNKHNSQFPRLHMDCNDHLYIYDGAHATGNFRVSIDLVGQKNQVEFTSKLNLSISSQLKRKE